jgi:hypothetical protein
LRHRRTRHWKPGRQFVHGMGIFRQRVKYDQPGGIPKRYKSVFYVSIHLR